MKNSIWRKLSFWFVALFGIAISFFYAATIFTPARTISSIENRSLAQKPGITISGIWNKTYFDGFSTFFYDQLYKRDAFIKTYTKLQMLLGKTFVNNYYITDDKWIIPRPAYGYYPDLINKSVENLKELKKDNPTTKFVFAVLPHKINALSNKYPSWVPKGSGEKNRSYFINEVQNVMPTIDVLKSFNEQFDNKTMDDLYFRTDHHWNGTGAYYGYQAIMEKLAKIVPIHLQNKEAFQEEFIHRNFLGSFNRQLYGLVNAKEEIPVWKPKQMNYTIYRGPVNAKNEVNVDSIFGSGVSKETVSYVDVYTTDYPELNVLNKLAKNDLHVVVIKDSYFDSMFLLLPQHFAHTTVLDLRYYQGSLNNYIKTNKPDIVLFTYNDTNLFSTTEHASPYKF
ncbi:DHHW family protein [Bacillus sp. 165]|uniref:DHHW family protein n=1 Tax=Bacillus sp. 165 TaxID=1529117 RepID=UPI001ADCA369|nr:DHHW family protein [Bacillus sp. 165]MBO9131524.1 hypothetical protein [Bacillus sp. 165]